MGLDHVYWVGGGSGGGKSTVTRLLTEKYSLRPYSTDAVMSDHMRRSDPTSSPQLHEFAAMDMDERWLNRSPKTMLDTFHWYRGEGFELIVDDLTTMSGEPGVVAEGFRLLPSLVQPLLTNPDHAVWLLPTPEFRSAAFESRGSLWSIAGKTSDPPRALENLLARDAMFTDRLREETRELGLHTIELSPATTVAELEERVTDLFGLTL
ncbi:hypothetical protein FB566_4036 [Stackebrandtia endophytica]|uniref:AAA domain-containing protein n=1 Tax=Stackebrandtia endophytica TaxID=1496996 RepID=A0A543B0V2_9ACTN|nr:hypothetical protein [Stackebrandtia endophytica]TQL78448.1 hypothetical protein FB566_4036 [Stackebrandtia endophytica]